MTEYPFSDFKLIFHKYGGRVHIRIEKLFSQVTIMDRPLWGVTWSVDPEKQCFVVEDAK